MSEALAALDRVLKPGGTITVIEGVREPTLAAGLLEVGAFDEGVRDLHRTAEQDGVFCYMFFKGVGSKQAP